MTYIIRLLFIFVALLVGRSLGLIRSALLVAQSLPTLAEDLANLTKRHAGVLLSHVIALLVGEEHVG